MKLDINKVYGTIQINGYSLDNKFASFQLYMYKPCKCVVALGVYNIEQEVTFVRKPARMRKEYSPYWMDLAKKILSSNDWDLNVRKVCKRHSYIPISTFNELRNKCTH